MSKTKWDKQLAIYDQLVDLCPDFDRKGKTMPYTSANGYMFSLLNKNAELGIRLPKPSQEKFKEDHKSTIYKSHGAVIKDYVLVPEHLLADLPKLAVYLNESYRFVMSLKKK